MYLFLGDFTIAHTKICVWIYCNKHEWMKKQQEFFIYLSLNIKFCLHVHVAFLSQLWKKIKIKLWEVICVSPGVDFGKAYDIQAHLKNERFYAAVTLKVHCIIDHYTFTFLNVFFFKFWRIESFEKNNYKSCLPLDR